MLAELRRRWLKQRLQAPEFAHLYEPERDGELVSLDCETTGLDRRRAELLAVGAVIIRGDRILTSRRLELLVRPSGAVAEASVKVHMLRAVDVALGLAPEAAIRRTLAFIGARPLVGYYLEFDVAMLEKYARPILGTGLPQRQIEVSRLYYDWRSRQLPAGANIDLRFETIRRHLDLPEVPQHDAFNDALVTAMMYLRLRRPRG